MTGKIPPRIEDWLKEGVRRRASDLFLIPGEPPTWRVRGELERSVSAPALSSLEVHDLALAVVGKEALDRVGREVGHLIRSCAAPVAGGRACLCIARSRGEVTMTVMLLPPEIATIQQINPPKALLEAIESKSGLVVISGAVGSGKTTTAYSLLNHLNLGFPRHISTVEEPMYVRLPPGKALVQQREVGLDVPDPIAGIQAAIRQDPDVLFFSEIHGVEELQNCVAAAELGLLVLTVLHLPTPEAAIRRMIDVLPEDVRAASCKALTSVLRCVSAQRLLPRADGKGRVAAYGVIVPDDQFRRLLIEQGSLGGPAQLPLPPGSNALAQDIRRLHTEGVITEETAAHALADLGE